MDVAMLKDAISLLNNGAFFDFITKLWTADDCDSENTFTKTSKLPRVGKHALEQYTYTRNDEGDKEQYYNLILPFLWPIELIVNSNLNLESLIDAELSIPLEKYRRLLQKRTNNWYWPQDGEYCLPNIAFVTNLSGVNRKHYFKTLIPQFQKCLDKIALEALAIVGSCDSFIELSAEKTSHVFNHFISNRKNDLVICFKDEIEVNEFIKQKYCTSGVLSQSKNPIESLYIVDGKSQVLQEFEWLINHNTAEKKLQKFIVENYKFILGDKYDRIETEVWLRFPELDLATKSRRIDFFVRNCLENDWELFELKKPHNLIRHKGGTPGFVSNLYTAIEQLKNYKNLLSQDTVKRKLLQEGIEYCIPELRLVIGRKNNIDHRQWRQLKSYLNDLKLITYDDLINEMNLRAKT